MTQVLKEEVKQEIKASGLDLFTRYGYKKTSMKAIAKKAGLSVGNLYRYYDNKHALYKDVISGAYYGVKAIIDQMNNPLKTKVSEGELTAINHQALKEFLILYHQEKDVFTMILKGERDSLYDDTILAYIDLLKNNFLKFWSNESLVSAYSHAMVFGVINLLEECDKNQYRNQVIEDHLLDFINPLIRGLIEGKERNGKNEK